jgi:hypothetical protein
MGMLADACLYKREEQDGWQQGKERGFFVDPSMKLLCFAIL